MKLKENMQREDRLAALVSISLIALVFIFNLPIAADLWQYSFDDGTYSHAYLVPFVSLYLIYEGIRGKQFQFRSTLPAFFIFVLIAVSALFALFYTAQIALPYRILFPLVLLLALFSVFKANIAVAMPAIVLWFMFPIWGILSPILQSISVAAVTFIMGLTSIPTYVEGNFVYIASGTFEIANGCSGLRYFIVSLLVSILFSYLNINTLKKTCYFMSVAILGALIVNWLRIVILIFVGHYTEMQSSLMDDHNTLGWYLYIPYLFALLWFGGKLQDPIAKPSATDHALQLTPAVVVAPLMVTLIFSSNAIVWLAQPKASQPVDMAQVDEAWQVAKSPKLQPELRLLTSKQLEQSYQTEVTQVDEPVSYYQVYGFNGTQESDNATYYEHDLLPQGWRTSKTLADDMANLAVIRQNGLNSAILAYWYEYNGDYVKQRNALRKQRLFNSLALDRNTYIHWLVVECERDCSDANAKMTRLLQNLRAAHESD